MEILTKTQMQILEIKNAVMEMKKRMPWTGISIDCTGLRKESENLEIHQEKFPKLKSNEKEE